VGVVEVKHDMGQHKALRTWLRDEEAACSTKVQQPQRT